ncbi:hypothetical protein DI041_00085 [Stenotrophomonas maltophilia]|uniref:fimbria/pilus outer membrane usher protein n=1 Tax=Stenotrophomonas maltophilia TaxID=40324 RepID=UPI0010AA7063|nr:fimbria/pilus outer membrane usher protein [Stenotrophomonas maltophilia]TIE21833.1 hypothetical protein DI034_01415 [Stenotrophomonas maltophilia]TIE65819.1 hypothetical protein DI041_00085 [Stenotrophomonas maltophilia]
MSHIIGPDTCAAHWAAPAGPLTPKALAVAVAAALTFAAGDAVGAGAATMADFDVNKLRSIGLDPEVATYFREAPRFSSGERRVSLVINGQPRGMVDARFDDSGALRFDARFLRDAGLKVPAAEYLLEPPEADVYDFTAAWPQALVKLAPDTEEVGLVVPSQALDVRSTDQRRYSSGGIAALVNYDINSSILRRDGRNRRSLSALTEVGFNAGDWIVRSRQSLSRYGNGPSRFDQIEAYAQRTLIGSKQALQLGELSFSNPLFSGAPITGMQLLPEEALQQGSSSVAFVEGTASSEATVEIRQAGVLLHSTVVPPGPFSIGDFRLMSQDLDLDVTVREAGGDRQFSVPAGIFHRARLNVPGTTFAAGRIRSFGSETAFADPVLVAATAAWRPKRLNSIVSAGAAATQKYHAVAVGVDTPLPKGAVLSTRANWATDRAHDVSGAQLEARLSTQLADRLSVNLSAAQRTPGYRDILESTHASDHWANAQAKRRLSAGVGWSSPSLGAFAASYGQQEIFAGRRNNIASASWSRQVGIGSLSLNLQHGARTDAQSKRSDTSVYASLTVPLGAATVRSTVRRTGDRTRAGVAVNQQVNPAFNYQAGIERDSRGGDLTYNAGFHAVPRYAQVAMGYTQQANSRSLSTRLGGGMLLHGEGVTLSPYALRETIGLVKVGERAGTRISTPAGTVWTDRRGLAALPHLTAFGKSRIEVDPTSLPRNYDLQNGVRTLEVTRGSVSRIEFSANTTRRVLLRIVDMDGNPVLRGASVAANGAFISSVTGNGAAFVNNFQPDSELLITLPDQSQCRVETTLPDAQKEDAFYETATAICHGI